MTMPKTGSRRAAHIEAALRVAFAPISLEIIDDSAKHAGHAGAAPGGETHYTVVMVAAAFQGMTRIARSRAVHTALEREFAGGLHALALTLRTPEEQARLAAGETGG
jgi:BolA protein